jgi:hypothetical protein
MSHPFPAGRVDHRDGPVHDPTDHRLAARTNRLRGSDPRADRVSVPQKRGSGSSSKRQLRRWSVARLIAQSLARPDDDVGEPWDRPRAPRA